MVNVLDRPAATDSESREIIIPHDPAAGPVTAVRNFLIQASLAELKANGHYERYARLIAPDVLAELSASLAPGWIPMDLALRHYEACENMKLDATEFAAMGKHVGDRVRDVVSLAKRGKDGDVDVWAAEPALHRMWPRIFQGGSVQIVKVGPREKLVEERGFRLNRFEYYRHAHVAALRATHGATGARNLTAKIDRYTPSSDELVVRVSWT